MVNEINGYIFNRFQFHHCFKKAAAGSRGKQALVNIAGAGPFSSFVRQIATARLEVRALKPILVDGIESA